MNKVILMGRLTADPEYKQTPQGVPVCTFSIAVDRPFSKNGNGNMNEPTADFFRVTAWRNQADFVTRYFNKGKPILVEGSIRNNNYTDKNGITHYTCDIVASSVSFCLTDNRNNGNGGYNNGYGNNYQPNGYGNNSYANGYNQGGYMPQGNNNYYQQPQPPQQQSAPVYQQPVGNDAPVQPVSPNNNAQQNGNANTNNPDLQVGQYDDFEEILSDGEIPF